MNDKLPFEDAFERQMNNMQPSGEDKSWQKMKTLLEKKKKRRPFAYFNFYQILGSVLLITLIFTGISIYKNKFDGSVTNLNSKSNIAVTKENKIPRITQPANAGKGMSTIKDDDDHNTATNKENVTDNPKRIGTKNFASNAKKTISSNSSKPGEALNNNNKLNNLTVTVNSVMPAKASDRFKQTQNNKKLLRSTHDYDIAAGKVKRQNRLQAGKEKLLLSGVDRIKFNKDLVRTHSDENDISNPDDVTRLQVPSAVLSRRGLEAILNMNILKNLQADTISQFQNVALTQSLKKDTPGKITKAADIKKANSENKKYFIAGGLGIEQQVPIGGQKAEGYNYNGNKNIFTDYIPSVYVRLEKRRHWFLQGEFSYAAPQLVKPFAYQQQTNPNFAAGAYTIHTTSIKKTFYNSVPVSFNYYILPRLSIGIGAAFNWLNCVVVENETLTKDVTTQQQTITSQLINMKGYKDSFLYRSHTNLLLQANYSVKRFNFSFGFAKDLQPYIKYTLPDGTVFKEKNWSMDFALRFRLYQSPNFSLLGKKIKKSFNTGRMIM